MTPTPFESPRPTLPDAIKSRVPSPSSAAPPSYMALARRHQLYMALVQRHQLCMAFPRANLHGFSARDLGMCCATKVLHRPGWRRVAYEWLSAYGFAAPPRAWLH